MYNNFNIFHHGSSLQEILYMLAIAGILGYLLCWLFATRKLREYWARINLNKHEIEKLQNAKNYDDLLTTLSTKIATFEKKLAKLKVPTLDQLDLSDYVTKDMLPKKQDLSNYVTKDMLPKKQDLSNYATKDMIPKKMDLSNYATKDMIPKIDHLKSFIKKDELHNLLPKNNNSDLDLSQFVKKDELNKDEIDTSQFALKSDLQKYALSNQLQKFASVDKLTSFVKLTDLKNHFKNYSHESADIVKKEDLSHYLRKSEVPEIPSMDNFAKKDDLAHYLRKSELPKTDLSQFAKKEELSHFLRKSEMPKSDESKFVKKDDLAPYLKKSELPQSPDFSGYAKKEDLNPLREKIETVDSENSKQDENIEELKAILSEIPKPKKKVVELDKRGIPKSTILHLLSIKDVEYDKRKRDDLQEIKGIGPFIEKKVNALGIYTFKQISLLNDEDISVITEAIKFFPGRIIRDDWVGQAEELAKA